MRRRDFLTMAAGSALPFDWKSAGAAKGEGTAREHELKTDTTDLGDTLRPTIVSCDGTLRLSQGEDFTRITIDKAAWPYGTCRLQKAGFDPQHPVFDFWIRVRGSHSLAFNSAFGKAGLGYGSGPPFGYGAEGHALNIMGSQIGVASLGDLGPINDGVWHHIVFDLAFALKTRLGIDLEKIGHAGIGINDFNGTVLCYTGGPPEPVPATIDLRDMVIRPPKPNEAYFNDLVFDVRSSSLGESSSGERKYLVAGSVISRQVLEDAAVVLGNGRGDDPSKVLGGVQGRKDFFLITMVRPDTSELRVKLMAGGKVLAERQLHLPPPLTYLQDATVNLIPSSHQDIAWLDTQESTGVWRREKGIGPAISLLEKYPDYRYGLEHTVNLMDYLSRKPFQSQALRKLIVEGRFCFGAMHNMPYQSLWGGESLLRQLYYGRKWLRENVGNDIPCVTAWNTDTPEVALQMPQILAKSGVKYYMLGRFRPGLFDWYSPDGSKVTVGSLGIYGQLAYYLEPFPTVSYPAANAMQSVALQVPELLQYWDGFYKEHQIPPEFPISDMTDFLPPTKEFIPLVHEWDAEGRQMYGAGFKIKFATAEEFMNSVTRDPSTKFPELRGEWVIPWGYIVPSNPRMVPAGREAAWDLISAEKFWALRYMACHDTEPYQRGTFDDAWMSHIYFDHGPGGLNGDITDTVFRACEEKARTVGCALLDSAVRWIAERATPLDSQSLKLVILNPLSWSRSGPTTVEIPTPRGQEPEIMDATGRTLPSQPLPQVPGGTLSYVVEARDIPSIGYSTFKVRFKPQTHVDIPQEKFKSKVYENQFYRLQFVRGGLKSIYDKQLRKELLNVEDFLGGEVFSLDSFGGDSAGNIGSTGETAQPSWQRIEKASQYSPNWLLIESGPVRSGWRMEQLFQEATIRLEVYAYQQSKRLDFDVAVLHWSGAIYREFRMAMPVNIPDGQVAYEVPYGVLEVGKDERQEGPWPGLDEVPSYKIHPRFVQNWISAGNGDFTVALSSLAATWDYLDSHEKKDRFTLLQPILLASRKSGHPQGNYFSPPGDHHYRFALTSFAGGWRNNFRFGDEVNSPFPAVVIGSLYGWEHERLKGRINESTSPFPPLPENPQGPIGSMSGMLMKFPPLALPSSLSLCQVSAPNYVVSDIKVADDQKGFIVRGYEITGRDGPVTLTFPLTLKHANATNLIEEDLPEQLLTPDNKVQIEVGHRSINAFRLQGDWKP